MFVETKTENLLPEHKVRLQKNYKKIANVKFHHMFDFLLAKDVINFIEYEEIRTEPILPDQNRKLIDILMLKDENAYQQFLDTLRLGDKCLSVVEDIETTIVTREEQKRLADILEGKAVIMVTIFTSEKIILAGVMSGKIIKILFVSYIQVHPYGLQSW